MEHDVHLGQRKKANPAIIIAVAKSYPLFLGTQKQHWRVLNNGDWGAV